MERSGSFPEYYKKIAEDKDWPDKVCDGVRTFKGRFFTFGSGGA